MMKSISLDCRHCGEACGHSQKVQRRTLSKSMVRALRYLATHAERTVHHEEGGKGIDGRTNYGKLKHIWGLAIDDPSKNGYWTITAKGWAFLFGEISVPRAYYTTLKNEVVAIADATLVSATEIYGEPYDGPRRGPEYAKLGREPEPTFGSF